MAELDPKAKEIVSGKNFATVTTKNDDGSIHQTVVWIDTENGGVALNSAKGRKWPTNLQRDPEIVITVPNWENPYEYVAIHGRAAEITPEGADEHINALSKKYLDKDEYPFRQEGEERLRIVVEPERVKVQG